MDYINAAFSIAVGLIGLGIQTVSLAQDGSREETGESRLVPSRRAPDFVAPTPLKRTASVKGNLHLLSESDEAYSEDNGVLSEGNGVADDQILRIIRVGSTPIEHQDSLVVKKKPLLMQPPVRPVPRSYLKPPPSKKPAQLVRNPGHEMGK